MKVLLIQPSRFRKDGRLDKRKRRWLLGMTLPYVAALVPKDIQVEIKDDLLEEITFQEKCDLVGLSFMSHQAPRAYQLAAGFRRRGIPVVMGGFHATLALEECRAHRRFYSPRSILQRLTTHLYSWHMLPFNLIYAWCVRRRVQPMDFF